MNELAEIVAKEHLKLYVENQIMETKSPLYYEDVIEIIQQWTFDPNQTKFKETKLMKVAREHIESYIEEFGYPPTYRKLAEVLNISTTATYSRTRHCRFMMKSHPRI